MDQCNGSQQVTEAFDLDSGTFSAEQYLKRVLKDTPLNDLMAMETDVYKQIQTLDSEMQTLVYENYNKYIAATHTVNRMTSDFAAVHREVHELTDSMSEITRLTHDINTSLQSRRIEINDLADKNKILSKLNFIFDLPTKMSAALDKNDYDEAVSIYFQSQLMMKHYSHITSIRDVFDEAAVVLERLVDQLMSLLDQTEPCLSSEKLTEISALLLKLAVPEQTISVKVLQQMRFTMTVAFSQLNVPSSPTSNSHISACSNILEYVDFICKNYLQYFFSLVDCYQSLFLNIPKQSEDNLSKQLQQKQQLQQFVTDHIDHICQHLHAKLLAHEADTVLVSDALDRFVCALRRPHHAECGVTALTASVRALLHRCTRHVCATIVARASAQLDQLLLSPTRHHDNRACDTTAVAAATAAVGADSVQLKERGEWLCRQVADRLAALAHSLGAGFNLYVHQWRADGLLAPLPPPDGSEREEHRAAVTAVAELCLVASESERCSVSVVRHVLARTCRRCLQAADRHLEAATEEEQEEGRSARSSQAVQQLLLLAHVFHQMACGSVLKELLESLGVHSLSPPTTAATAVTPALDLDIDSQLRHTHDHLLRAYVSIQTQSISEMFRIYLQNRRLLHFNSVATGTPSIRISMKSITEHFSAVSVCLQQLYPSSNQKAGSIYSASEATSAADSFTSHRRRSSAENARMFYSSAISKHPSNDWFALTIDTHLASNVKRLFSDQVDVFSPIHPTYDSILSAIVKLSLKSLLEHTRLCVFNTHTLKQFTSDLHHLQCFLSRFFLDAGFLKTMVEDIEACLVYRCVSNIK